ncbi:hypothetical protein QBC42DRAFT_317414 [Cladorrhinum samala]|uniref:Uncharacterized protein n=1 Tax=Cladorrhinum samala TaxID=585594 RepID=A0AAV9HAC8_9PEZI|nr:hypothetical protein QBC42DRAFT_317414 [Cladorrhinum samala]
MAGSNTEIDPAQCAHYAAFASHLGRREFDFIYWFLFILVIAMLFLSSWKYSGDLDKVQDIEPGSREYRNRMKKCFYICGLYASISVVAVVMEVYALMALQFCDGEDLMPLYWSTWTMMQVGSLIAVFGILLSVSNSLRGRKNPPWALALGTPVLVVAGIGHAFHHAVRKRAVRIRSRSASRARPVSTSSSNGELNGVPMSREQTIFGDESEKDDSEIPAKLVGYAVDGSPILRFTEDPGKISRDRGDIICRGENGHVIVVFRKEMTTIFPSSASTSPTIVVERPLPTPSSSSLTVPRSPVVKIELPTESRAASLSPNNSESRPGRSRVPRDSPV